MKAITLILLLIMVIGRYRSDEISSQKGKVILAEQTTEWMNY